MSGFEKGKFVSALMSAAEEKGAKLIHDEVTGLMIENDAVVGVQLGDDRKLRGHKTVLAMGPWTGNAQGWIDGVPEITGDKAHSIVFQPDDSGPAAIDNTAVFIGYSDKGKMEHPEIYPRPDGSVYVCGCGDDTPLPESAEQVAPSPARCAQLVDIAGTVTSHLKGLAPVIQ